jgi:DNA ligase-associated metallophosphoesterase
MSDEENDKAWDAPISSSPDAIGAPAEPTPGSEIVIDIGGHALHLSAGRAAFDPATRSLFIADAHFGKGATFRVHGIPVPGGTTQNNLGRLDQLIDFYVPDQVVFLGDLLHAKPAQATSIIAALDVWRKKHAAITLVLVKGNHDRHAGSPASHLGFIEVEEPWMCGPWTLCHHPTRLAGQYVLAGHEHPTFQLRGATDALRLPCFHFGTGLGVLPAFGDFTGGHPVRGGHERLFVVAGDKVLEIEKKHLQGMRKWRSF